MLCPLVRWQLSGALDRGGARPRLAAAHLPRCAGCRAFADRIDALHGRLVAGALVAPRPADPRTVAPRPGSRALVRRGAFALGGAAMIVALVLLARPGQPRDAEVMSTADPAPGSPASAAGAGRPDGVAAPDQVAAAAVPGSASHGHLSPTRDVFDRLSVLFTAPSPLRAELDALASDGRRGARAILHLGGVRL
ncbi:MAG TPA: hypothetical protein VEL05_12365 [Candidatus Acidoferrum sp.]|nr:hypothetical protein [Candidatus Acidoferrum sp.]